MARSPFGNFDGFGHHFIEMPALNGRQKHRHSERDHNLAMSPCLLKCIPGGNTSQWYPAKPQDCFLPVRQLNALETPGGRSRKVFQGLSLLVFPRCKYCSCCIERDSQLTPQHMALLTELTETLGHI